MIKASADTEAGGSNILVAPEDTVPPKVDFKNRNVTDKWWGVLYVLSYIAFLSTGFFLVSQAKERYTYSDGARTGISDHFLSEAQECCADDTDTNGICSYVNGGTDRRLASTSKFDGDEGIFDAFIEAPEIIFGLTALTLGIAIAWVVALRFLAREIVILSELCKIAIFIVAGVYSESFRVGVFCFAVAAALAAYAIWARAKILFAAKMIAHSTIAMKENPSIFIGGLFCKLLFVGNAAFFVYFFAESFNVVEVKKSTSTYSYYTNDGSTSSFSYCSFESPSYVGKIDWFLCVSYLWSILLFEKMRLSIIAGVVGSWHFHPLEKPSVWLAIRNIGPSFGTLSVSALISSIAEYINKTLNQTSGWCSPTICFTWPLRLVLCCCGACFKTLIQMLTKYSVILHVFTGKPFVGSAKSVFKIMSRHFKGGFVTEVTSKSALTLGSYAFSLGIAMVTWKWVDDEFDCKTLSKENDSSWFILYVLMILFNAWYPILGIYIMIIVNQLLQTAGKSIMEKDENGEVGEAFNHLWIPPLAACFVGCIAMLMFTFLSAIFLDTIDTLFLCFAIDKDNNVINPDDEFATLLKEMPNYTEVQSESSLELKEDAVLQASVVP